MTTVVYHMTESQAMASKIIHLTAQCGIQFCYPWWDLVFGISEADILRLSALSLSQQGQLDTYCIVGAGRLRSWITRGRNLACHETASLFIGILLKTWPLLKTKLGPLKT